jgi:endonuclease YncB( thermonuclease family)
MSTSTPRLLVLALLFIAPPTAPAQDGQSAQPTPSSSHLELRGKYLAEIGRRTKDLARSLDEALRAEEASAAALRDYQTALRFQQERQDLASQRAAMEKEAAEGAVVLNTENCRPPVGRIQREGNTFTTFGARGSAVTWEQPRFTPGTYEVVANYAHSDEPESRTTAEGSTSYTTHSGDFSFYLDTSLGSGENRKVEHTVQSTGGWGLFKDVNLGFIEIPHTTARFKLEITRTTGRTMNLRTITLIPATSPTGTPQQLAGLLTPPGSQPQELVALRSEHSKSLQAALEQAAEPLISQLEKLESSRILAGDIDGASAAGLMLVRAAQGMADPLKAPPPGATPTAHGFDQLDGAQFVEHERNSGDRFYISHGGQILPIRLYFVECPPTTPSGPFSMDRFAEGFGITKGEAEAIGKEAADFTGAMLSAAPFSFRTRWAADEDGAYFAFVIPAHGFHLDQALVSRGLALPIGRGTHLVDCPENEFRQVYLALRDKAREAGHGGWRRSAPSPPQADPEIDTFPAPGPSAD